MTRRSKTRDVATRAGSRRQRAARSGAPCARRVLEVEADAVDLVDDLQEARWRLAQLLERKLCAQRLPRRGSANQVSAGADRVSRRVCMYTGCVCVRGVREGRVAKGKRGDGAPRCPTRALPSAVFAYGRSAAVARARAAACACVRVCEPARIPPQRARSRRPSARARCGLGSHMPPPGSH
eukprot:6193431-Pleurochrysis_carterae.AAC.2